MGFEIFFVSVLEKRPNKQPVAGDLRHNDTFVASLLYRDAAYYISITIGCR